jgi:hypothetical protein
MGVTISPDNIKEIADQLESGMKCWYHIPTEKILWAPGSSGNWDIDEEVWEEVFNEIEEKEHECIAFERLDAKEEFRVMADFAENEVDDPQVRDRLIYALNQRKPFMHFKSEIHYNEKYLEAWYVFKQQNYIQKVVEQLDSYNQLNDNKDDNDE